MSRVVALGCACIIIEEIDRSVRPAAHTPRVTGATARSTGTDTVGAGYHERSH